jgi:LysM repeat protein
MSSPKHSKYTVRKGDTLERIARLEYGAASAWHLIARANGIKRDRILVGAKLSLPPLHPAHAAGLSVKQHKHGHTDPSHLPHRPAVTPPAPAPPPHSAYAEFETFSHAGDLLAKELRFPATKVPATIPLEPVIYGEGYTIQGSIECEGVLQQAGTMTEVEISKDGLQFSGKLSSEYKTALSNLTGGAEFKFDPAHPESIGFSSSLTVTNKVGGKVINIAKTDVKLGPPRQLIYSTGPQKFESQTPYKFNFEGQVSFKITVTFDDDRRKQPSPVRVPVVAPASKSTVRDWKPIIVGGAIFVGVSVVTFGWADIVAGGTAVVGAAVEFFGAESVAVGAGALVLVQP